MSGEKQMPICVAFYQMGGGGMLPMWIVESAIFGEEW